ncbi:ABC transporter ATP-binding protein [Hoeflea prorocentri]|uniref:ATP-binding cassette domain-containing protein n=1 Tax=Hoeflea prorocentri TaxID=1922333 RepID=A0A9X3UFL2_9HYPH|nr:ATP-binding cassette domain-containing protein [Hoeflea prorocentri]MCY6379640.1 ATP-binding cassette domain-containing protein [Hoeflea prorocentri]MDA5397440.1 ATP-binding cassette domain-containing protein [Hoeflea prorocentri]
MLEFSSVNVSVGGVRILRDLHFEVGEAQTVALIGHNGAGKTTTLRTVMGLIEKTGTIEFDGVSLDSVAPSGRPGLGIGYAPEDRRLFSSFTVEENILLAGEVAGLDAGEMQRRRSRIDEILPELRELGNRPAGGVSGGQGKMVALGRALMIGTKLIMLDEPFQGLAPALAVRYADALRRLRDADRSVSMIITESNPALLDDFADRVLMMERGEITEKAR